MQKEFRWAPDFDQWYVTEQEQMRSVPMMSFFVEARNVTVKQQHVPTRAEIKVNITDAIGVSDSVGVTVKSGDGTEERTYREQEGPERSAEPEHSKTSTEWKWYFVDVPLALKKRT